MILFHDWNIESNGLLGRQFDNLSRRLEVTGDLPDGWNWAALVQVGDAMDIIPLERTDGGAGHTLTEDQLSLSGYYAVQLRGTQGDAVRHTNVIYVFVSESLSGSGQWPVIPTEFTELERRLARLNAHPAVPGENGFWMLWNVETGEYVESAFPYVGEQGSPGKDNLPNVTAVTGTEVTLTLDHNVEYRCAEEVTALTVEGFAPAEDGKVSMWAVQFTAGESITVTIPETVKWAVADPVFNAGVTYWLSFVPLVDDTILGVWLSNE